MSRCGLVWKRWLCTPCPLHSLQDSLNVTFTMCHPAGQSQPATAGQSLSQCITAQAAVQGISAAKKQTSGTGLGISKKNHDLFYTTVPGPIVIDVNKRDLWRLSTPGRQCQFGKDRHHARHLCENQ
ncbi:hypothetical protein FKM82_011754 [Ascaphus truei]